MTKHLAPDFIYTPQGLQSNMLITISDVGLITSITPVGAQFIIPFRLPEPQARTQSVGSRNTDPASTPRLDASTPTLDPHEQADFERAYETLTARTHLAQSLERQKRARLIIRTWRSIHIVLACLALLIILYHGTMELLTQVLHVLPV